MKPAVFHPKVKVVISDFPKEVRNELGHAVFDIQKGAKLQMPLSKAMTSIGSGVEELRIADRSGQYRVFYISKIAEYILIFHAFVKKTQRTPNREIEIAKKRLKEMLHEEKY